VCVCREREREVQRKRERERERETRDRERDRDREIEREREREIEREREQAMLDAVRRDLSLDPSASFAILPQPSAGRPRPLYLSTATQVSSISPQREAV
jgi:hypothetical protein